LDGGNAQWSVFPVCLWDIHPPDWRRAILLPPELVGEPLNEGFIYVVFGLSIDSCGFTPLILANSLPGFGEPGFFTDCSIESAEAMLWILFHQFAYMLLHLLDVYHSVSCLVGAYCTTCKITKAS
jgi:hypothetical protein